VFGRVAAAEVNVARAGGARERDSLVLAVSVVLRLERESLGPRYVLHASVSCEFRNSPLSCAKSRNLRRKLTTATGAPDRTISSPNLPVLRAKWPAGPMRSSGSCISYRYQDCIGNALDKPTPSAAPAAPVRKLGGPIKSISYSISSCYF
jgi:hypothetical protein